MRGFGEDRDMFQRPLSFVLASTLLCPVVCRACATEAEDPVRVTDESALIVWNSHTHTEQFVRRATFESKAKNFGFLVPTPSRPTLSAADDSLFDSLTNELEPKTITKTRQGVDFAPLVTSFFFGGNSSDSSSTTLASTSNMASRVPETKSLEVVEEKHIGNYKAVVLRASDTKSLTQWLKRHHYPVSSDTRDWLAPYVRRGFFLSVFQIVSEQQSESAQAQAVRLTFRSDAPFYPYREPKHAQSVGGGRSLRVFFVGENRMGARIENEGRHENWSASTTYSAPLASRLLTGQKLEAPTGSLRLTAFEDDSSPRPGWGDLKFSMAKTQSEITPPPNIIWKDERHWIPGDVLALCAVMVAGFVLWRRKRKTSHVLAEI